MRQDMYYLRYHKIRWIIAGLVLALSLAYSQDENSTAPTFYLTDLSGNDFFASRVYGDRAIEPSAVVLSFFATWCIPCRAEAPQLELLSQEYPEIKFYLVSVKDPAEKILSWLNQFGVELPVLVDMYGRTAEKFGVIAKGGSELAGKTLPTIFVIDQTGKIIYEHSGYTEGDELKLKKVLETLN